MKSVYFLVSSLLLLIAPEAAARCSGEDSLPDDEVFRVLLDHNLLRSWAAEGSLSSGKRKLPPGENMYFLEYSCELEELAKAAVKGCPATKTVKPQLWSKFSAVSFLHTLLVQAELFKKPVIFEDVPSQCFASLFVNALVL
ncbi:hypothetical protein OESDEN_08440 [Oesophagostomum dentatum]|uniref:SCP domain-containing protein n=1 Tax=Oesophagostomum dentatum TaxID=61180 RepID=A0A0B1T8L2_OESDE|nr:hypothetical protein OESDEN_08440 [Oesophagostomum dentatum]